MSPGPLNITVCASKIWREGRETQDPVQEKVQRSLSHKSETVPCRSSHLFCTDSVSGQGAGDVGIACWTTLSLTSSPDPCQLLCPAGSCHRKLEPRCWFYSKGNLPLLFHPWFSLTLLVPSALILITPVLVLYSFLKHPYSFFFCHRPVWCHLWGVCQALPKILQMDRDIPG